MALVRRRSRMRLGFPAVLFPVWGFGITAQAGSVNRVHLHPIWIPCDCIVDQIGARCTTASAGNNFRLGLYGQGTVPGSPTGARLLAQSGDIAAAVGNLVFTLATPVRVPRGIAWVALSTQDAVMNFGRGGTTTTALFAGTLTANWDGCYYDLGGWGVLDNICPATPTSTTAKFGCFIHLLSWEG
jgi:hypothetical protein